MKPQTEHDRRSLASYRGWSTRRHGKEAPLTCPVCGQTMPKGALDHEKRKHVDLYQRRARKHGDLI